MCSSGRADEYMRHLTVGEADLRGFEYYVKHGHLAEKTQRFLKADSFANQNSYNSLCVGTEKEIIRARVNRVFLQKLGKYIALVLNYELTFGFFFLGNSNC